MIIENKKIFLYHKGRNSNIIHLYDTEKFEFKDIVLTIDNIGKTINFFRLDTCAFCGYGNSNYEDVFINILITQQLLFENMSDSMILKKLKELDDTLFSNDSSYVDEFKYYKYMHKFNHFDLSVLLFSVNKRPELDDLQYTLDVPLELNGIKLIEYIFKQNQDQIKARLNIEQRFDIDLLDKPDIDIGLDILKKYYLTVNNLQYNDIKNLRSECGQIKLNELIDITQFDLQLFPEIVNYINTETYIHGYSNIEKTFAFNNLKLKFGLGGIKFCEEPNSFYNDDTYTIINLDATSFYPSIAVNYCIKPSHLNEAFIDCMRNMLSYRIIAKNTGKLIESQQMKRALNAIIGKMMYDSWLYDPKAHTKLVLIGNAIILSLISMIVKYDSEIIQINTDGIYFKLAKESLDHFEHDLRRFIDIYKIDFQFNHIKEYHFVSPLDTISIDANNVIKKSGCFDFHENYGHMNRAKIINLLAFNNIVFESPINENTLKSCFDDDPYCIYEFIKAPDGYGILYNQDVVSRLRYFYSNKGINIFQCKRDFNKIIKHSKLNKNTTGIDTYRQNITIDDLDTKYYIKEAQKIVSIIKNKQLTLF